MTLKLEFQLEPEFAEVDLAVDLDLFFLRFMERDRVVALDLTSGRKVYRSER